MPIRNVGTLLEHLVTVESARILLERVPPGRAVDFTNSFAMPPFSAWEANENDAGFSEADLQRLVTQVRAGAGTSYPDLLRACLRTGQGGPNTAMLVGLVAVMTGRRLRMWLNDLADGRVHYPKAVDDLRNTESLLRAIGPSGASVPEVAVCGEAYPASVTTLADTIQAWHESAPAAARLGFLDPMKYTVSRDRAAFNHTTREDHREWLGVVGSQSDIPVLSVHFTANRNQPALAAELHAMSQDGLSKGYPVSVEFRHSYFAVVVNVRDDGDRAVALADTLEESVTQAWGQWFREVVRRRSACSLVATRRVRRHPPPRGNQGASRTSGGGTTQLGAAIDALLPFLPAFESDRFRAGEWHIKEGVFPFLSPAEEVVRFVKALYDHGWVVPFDWPEWRPEAERYVGSPESVAGADFDTLRKLLTTHVRQDRFCEGHLAAMIETGHIAAVLRRLRELRGSQEGTA